MFDATEDKRLIQPLRFMIVCVVIFAVLALMLNLRRFGFAQVFRIGTPIAALAIAWTWLKADDSKVTRQLGNGILVFMCIASIADVVWSIFLP
jgi:hypothetical protein